MCDGEAALIFDLLLSTLLLNDAKFWIDVEV